MNSHTNPVSERETETKAILLNVGEVAALLGCSERHVFRMADAGKMPAPVRVGALVRWDRRVVEQWIVNGCPPVRR